MIRPVAGASPPLVTVVIPTHNRRQFLPEAVCSALSQGPSVAKVVVVDDGSTDGTSGWLTDQGDPRLQVLRQRPAGGGAAARNLGLDQCSTPLVLFLDDDDRLRPGAIDTLVRALVREPGAAGAGGAGRRFEGERDLGRVVHPRLRLVRPIWKEVLFCWGIYPATLLWWTDVVRSLGGWNSDLRRFEDRDLVLRAYPRPFVLVPDLVADLRVHPGQLTRSDQDKLDRRLRQSFVDRLPEPDRRVGQAIIEAAVGFDDALEQYRTGDALALRQLLRRALAPATTLRYSPVLAPWLNGLAARAALFASLPGPLADALREGRRRLTRTSPGSERRL